MKRRLFLNLTALASFALFIPKSIAKVKSDPIKSNLDRVKKKPVIISTWNHGLAANKAAWEKLETGGTAIDAVEAGVRITESDETTSET